MKVHQDCRVCIAREECDTPMHERIDDVPCCFGHSFKEDDCKDNCNIWELCGAIYGAGGAVALFEESNPNMMKCFGVHMVRQWEFIDKNVISCHSCEWNEACEEVANESIGIRINFGWVAIIEESK